MFSALLPQQVLTMGGRIIFRKCHQAHLGAPSQKQRFFCMTATRSFGLNLRTVCDGQVKICQEAHNGRTASIYVASELASDSKRLFAISGTMIWSSIGSVSFIRSTDVAEFMKGWSNCGSIPITAIAYGPPWPLITFVAVGREK